MRLNFCSGTTTVIVFGLSAAACKLLDTAVEPASGDNLRVLGAC